MTIRVLVADDQAMIRGALAGLLDLERDIEVVAQAADGAQALDELARLAGAPGASDPSGASGAARASAPVDVAIIDVEMPRMDGITATQAIRERFPGVRVLIVTTFGRPGYLQRALDAGAPGFTVKDTPVETLAEGVRLTPDGSRGRRVARGRRRRHDRRHRPFPPSQPGDGAQPRVLVDAEDERAHARRGRVPGPRRRLAVGGPPPQGWYQSDTITAWL